jgi:hypothetical protein
MTKLVLGIDFDGTIVEEGFPKIGKIKPNTVELMKKAYELGHLVIVWTARSGEYEQDAVNFLNENNIPYHYINCNPEDPFAIKGEQGRKIFCHYYLDDRAVHVDDIDEVYAAVVGRPYQKHPCRAVLKGTFFVSEVDGNAHCTEYDMVAFEAGDTVEVLKEVTSKDGIRQFIIYSRKVNESTVVHIGLLNFID